MISQTAEYAIRAITYLALLPKEKVSSASVISKSTKIPTAYLSKILRQLVNADLLKAQKGPKGGFYIEKPLNEITILSVVQAVGYEMDENHCAFGWDKCNSVKPCPLHNSYNKLKASYYKWAEGTTLSHIKKSNQ